MSIINEADYAWSRHVVTVPVGTTAFELPVKIYAARGDGALWLDSEATTAVTEFPVAVDEITVTGAEMILIGEQGKGVPVASTYLDTAEGMTALEWTSRTDKFTVPLPFEFKWAGTAYTEFISVTTSLNPICCMFVSVPPLPAWQLPALSMSSR